MTRTSNASFANSVVFPGGVCEPADGTSRWLDLLRSYGYTQQDFAALHRSDSAASLTFGNNPIQRHIQLRITAIRETFEELGLLICSQKKKEDKSGFWADTPVTDIDVKHWQTQISNNPEQLYDLCKQYNCYPDIWSLHYWSNWLTPRTYQRRFDTVFFVTGLQNKPDIESNSEVAKVEWLAPKEVLNNSDKILFPPQVYELSRLSQLADIEDLLQFARARSSYGTELLYPCILKAKDGLLHLLPGDDLYPSSIDYNDNTPKYIDKSLLELRESCKTLHRCEINKETKKANFVLQNYNPENHINMGDLIIPTGHKV